MRDLGAPGGAGRGPGELRLLVLTTEDVTERRSGPEIRGVELAKALAQCHDVAMAVPGSGGGVDSGLRVLTGGRLGLLREAAERDAVIAHWVPAYVLAALARRSTLLVADLYDPVDVEAATLPGVPQMRRWREIARVARDSQLRFADLIVCASRQQREDILDELASLATSRRPGPEVVVVPFGIGAAPPAARRRPLRERFEPIADGDPVILWWGSIWKWMDAPTAIRAAALLSAQHPNLRLVFTAGVPPQGHGRSFTGADEARDLADSLGQLDRTVFFIDDWIPYDERHEYLQDADVGLNLHRDPHEASLSARARYMDFLWTALPCVLSEGNEVARDFAGGGFARLVPAGEAEQTASALADLLFDQPARERASRAAGALAASYSWQTLVEPLEQAIAAVVHQDRRRRGRALEVVMAAAEYYARRAMDEWAQRASGLLPRVGR